MLDVSPGSAYLLLIPQMNGVRLTWIRDCDLGVTMPGAASMPRCVQPLFSRRPTVSFFPRPVKEMQHAWGKRLTHAVTGHFIGKEMGDSYSYNAYTGKIQVAMETYFDVEKLALEINPSTSKFWRNFDAVGINNGGRSLELVLAFHSYANKADDLFVSVEVDLFTQYYDWKKMDSMRRRIPLHRCADDLRATRLGYGQHVFPAPGGGCYPGLWIRPAPSESVLYPDCYVENNDSIITRHFSKLPIHAKEAPISVMYA